MASRCFTPDLSGRDLLLTVDFTADELIARRRRIAGKMGEEGKLLLVAAPPTPSGFALQDANFYYFAGLEACHACLLIDGATGESELFLPSRDTMVGEPENRIGHEDDELIRERLGVDRVDTTEALTGALADTEVLFLPDVEVEGGGATWFASKGCAERRQKEPWDQAEPRYQRLVRLATERIPGVEIRDAGPLIREMRTIKSPAEIEVMRQAGQLAAAAVTEGMKATEPGMVENRLQAIAEYVFRDQGHCGLGYGVIAAGGRRTWDGHYQLNNATLAEDEIVLMDCGPDLRHYTSDIARLWPVNGVFSDWHRRVYGFIVEYHKTLLALVRPGVLVKDIYEQSEKTMADLCMEPDAPWHDMKPIFEAMVEKGVRYLNHAVGLSVHDAVGPWQDQPLKEGFVGVMDPMVWCEDRHEYIRVEDTFVVTADGCERLTGDAPFEIDDIEAVMR
ncbi:MAG: Xaa-Pro peptidase family protein [Phycisphaeraceae bacterium]|nr:Xaa-Pro peptidase family protein [Phycisphaeraceae bacterium]